MRLRTLILGSLCACFALAAVAPAFADDDYWRRREFEGRERQGFYAPPPGVVAPSLPFVTPRAYGYAAPPPVYYVNPR